MTQQPDPFSELRGLMEKGARGISGLPWKVVPEAGKPILRGQVGNIAHGFIATWPEFDLIVAAVNALPALLDERDRLIAEVAEAKRMAHEAFCIGVSHQEARRAAEAEVEKLKALLKPICSEFAQSHPLIASARQALSQEIG